MGWMQLRRWMVALLFSVSCIRAEQNTYVKDSTTCVRVCEVKLLHVQVKLLLVSIASASKQSS